MSGAAHDGMRDAKGRFVPGHAKLRTKGRRKAVPTVFLDMLQADWREHGADCIARLRRADPLRYLMIMIAIVPGRSGGRGRSGGKGR